MNVLSLFDGMSCGQIALERAEIAVDKYYASEIKPHAIELVKRRYPNTIQLGDIRGISELPGWIDLLIGGSPCKGISGLNQKREGLKHKESILFWEYVRLLRLAQQQNPDVKFLLENVRGNKESINIISSVLGVRPIKLNSGLVSAQNRPRLYWTNIPVHSIPSDRKITTEMVFTREMIDELICNESRVKWLTSEGGLRSVKRSYSRINPYPKAGCIIASGHDKWNCNYIFKNGKYKVLSIRELEALQTLPLGYCDDLKYGQAYNLIGDGWTIDIIAHIFKYLKQ